MCLLHKHCTREWQLCHSLACYYFTDERGYKVAKNTDAIELGSNWIGWRDDCFNEDGKPAYDLALLLTELFVFVQESQDAGQNVYATIGRGRTDNKALITINVEGEKRYASGLVWEDVVSSLQAALSPPTVARKRR